MPKRDHQVPQVATVGERLRRLRKERKLTQSDLARQIGIQQSDLSRMEQGEYRVSLDNLFKLLAVLGMGIAEFFGNARPEPETVTVPLSQDDMSILPTLRELSQEGRDEIRQFVEFKLRRERAERRSVEFEKEQQL